MLLLPHRRHAWVLKTDADDNDKGLADKMTAARYLNIFNKLTK